MNRDPSSQTLPVPVAQAVAHVGAAHRPQFPLWALLLAMLVTGVVCATIRGLGSIWLVPIGLAGLSATNLTLAVLRGSNGRMLKLGYWHLASGLALAAVASALAVYGCLEYNAVAGTDKTPSHIIQISAAVLAGPMVGPVANPGAGETPQAWTYTAVLFSILLATAAPFLLARRIVPLAIACLCWLAFLSATVLWFFGAMISLGVFLS